MTRHQTPSAGRGATHRATCGEEASGVVDLARLRYIDSASRLLDHTMFGWLQRLLPSARRFACQSGYYRHDALAAFASEVQTMLGSGGRFDLVIGANEERLSAPDLEDTLDLIAGHQPSAASFTLVGARNALFHPKAYYVELRNGERHAAVGSANFTVSGLGHNLEACLLLHDPVDDPEAVDAVRDAILAWPQKAAAGSDEARPITAQYIRELEAERAIDPAPVEPRTPVAGRTTTGRSSFAALRPIPGAPRGRARARPRVTSPPARLGAAPAVFPPDVIGIVKRLSRTDVKGFVGGAGTPYIALPPNPTELADKLPMRPYGRRSEPRLDLIIEARLSTALADVVSSGTDATNITHVGMGVTRGSNPDLRLNIQHGMSAGVIYVATQRALALPAAGDAVAIEFLDRGRLVRMTFATADPLRSELLSHMIPGRRWGWLPAGATPRW